MKNKILAFAAFGLLVTGIAFASTQSNQSGRCCDPQAATCNGVPCPNPDACPVPCCESGSTCK